MKKIILILFLFFLLYACYIIYNLTEDKNKYVTLIGDNIANNPYLKNIENTSVNNDFINKDYHINDLLNVIKYNQELDIDNKIESIHQLLKKSDVVILSIGMNDLYYKLNDNTKEIYTYLNNMINNYEIIIREISRYDYQNVYILGYYNITNKNNDIFTYINYKLSSIAKNYNYSFIDTNKILNNKPEYYQNERSFNLNNKGYYQIFNILVENLKKSWYNIKCIYYYDLY